MNDRLRILVTSSYGYWGDATPDDLYSDEKQIGGGETAMMAISRELAARGHEVIMFYGHQRVGQFQGIDLMPEQNFTPLANSLEHDVLISWDNSYAFRTATRSKVRVLAFQLNDAFIGPFTHLIDAYMHPSQWHMHRFQDLYPEMLLRGERSHYGLTNGVDYSKYFVNGTGRNPKKVIYTSSPDRGLHHLLRIWPKVVEAVPDAELHVFYEIDNWLKMVNDATAAGLRVSTTGIAKEIEGFLLAGVPRVQFRKAVGRETLIKEQTSAQLMVYPCDPVQPTEGYSMSVHEALAAGCQVITSEADAFPELWSGIPSSTLLPLPINDEEWIAEIVSQLTSPRPVTEYRNLKRSWDSLGKEWDTILRRLVHDKSEA